MNDITSEITNDMDKLPTVRGGAMAQNFMDAETVRAAKEVEGAIISAKKFPRDQFAAHERITQSCKRRNLAKNAVYAYPRGGQIIEGPTIRLAEVLAQNWGNLQFGIRELSRGSGESTIESYCWDVESNVRATRVFTVTHERYSKNKGITKLTDPRDIYEHIANYGARRLRACILEIIPKDICDDAVEKCGKTLAHSGSGPIIDRIKNMIVEFSNFGINQEMIEERMGHNFDTLVEQELAQLIKIFISIRDGYTKREDWFKFEAEGKSATNDLNEKVAKTPKAKKEKKKAQPKEEEEATFENQPDFAPDPDFGPSDPTL